MSEIITAAHAEQAGHWYKKDGSPAYEIIGKNGQPRPTTLRDARKENLVPSVTTILKEAAKPGLINWMIDQAILSALTCPRIDGEDETAYLSRLKNDSKEQARKAAERGTLIHSWVQAGFEGKRLEGEPWKYYISAYDTVMKECGRQDWICEKSFATDKYGGKVDLHNDEYLIDIKTTEKDFEKLDTYDEHHMQLAAYDNGLPPADIMRKCGILYIHTKTAESKLIWIEFMDYDKGWKMFNALLDFWYAKTGL